MPKKKSPDTTIVVHRALVNPDASEIAAARRGEPTAVITGYNTRLEGDGSRRAPPARLVALDKQAGGGDILRAGRARTRALRRARRAPSVHRRGAGDIGRADQTPQAQGGLLRRVSDGGRPRGGARRHRDEGRDPQAIRTRHQVTRPGRKRRALMSVDPASPSKRSIASDDRLSRRPT